MTRKPKVSVVMPVYNAERYLPKALESILSQAFSDFELIVIDDGSTDKSLQILEEYAENDRRVRIIRQENGGVSKSCNAGILIARGIYIARMDADDIAYPNRLARQVSYMDSHPEIVALGSQYQLIDPEGRALTKLPNPKAHDEIDRSHLRGTTAICHPTAIIRTAAMRDIGAYSDDFPAAEDIDLFLRLAEVGRLENLEEVLLDYRQHLKSVGYSKYVSQVNSAWRAACAAAKRRGLPMPEAPDPSSDHSRGRSNVFRTWGWWALADGNVKTARYYALRTLWSAPLSSESWRLLVMAIRGY